MCINFTYVWLERGNGYVKQQVPCRKCWQCKEDLIRDYTGRCLAEARDSDWVMTMTLTYAPRDDGAEKLLDKSHFQKFMKLLRKHGHNVRYLVVGEYGDLKGRAHFHCILFGVGKTLLGYDNIDDWEQRDHTKLGLLPQKERCWIDAWPHGHVYVDHESNEKAFRYTLKYLRKRYGEKRNYWFSLSKKPSLGAKFFKDLAVSNAEQLILPYNFNYTPPGVFRKDRPYKMTGTTRKEYLLAIRDWFIEHGHLDLFNRLFDKATEWVSDAMEKAMKWRFLKTAEIESFEKIKEDIQSGRPRIPDLSKDEFFVKWLNRNTLRQIGDKIDNWKEQLDGEVSAIKFERFKSALKSEGTYYYNTAKLEHSIERYGAKANEGRGREKPLTIKESLEEYSRQRNRRRKFKRENFQVGGRLVRL